MDQMVTEIRRLRGIAREYENLIKFLNSSIYSAFSYFGSRGEISAETHLSVLKNALEMTGYTNNDFAKIEKEVHARPEIENNKKNEIEDEWDLEI